ncbi:hypothetical protein CANTEDRAFT_123827 [Yamadazyma tenuis ATCC 10573]|uniref:DNA mismatch repair protein MSH3 n=1 Tax=Candida tenuis (strain ATCC 10573 / BCRC 21748 / CBS 615 / JCM 9827 / NBRC 10315 / NRRL Y-1498 / VKM Y-70) TaxID=590646 RepID=G3B6J6_CANTC|nr:uncharacterized protein CANTEDRAFT_123827 [Yamadazyma tenuis ATCC 10573]EGV63485.1 hypothetical protein CANTEDRAFT_123827 [Yamadazyma tenuis ATCC 10573]
MSSTLPSDKRGNIPSSSRPDLKFGDNLEERRYYSRFSDLPAKNPNLIRFTDHNNKDYFTAIDDDATLIADAIFKTQSVIKTNQNNKNKYVTIAPQVFLNNVLKYCLIENNYKVEIYDHKTFSLIAMGTPGNLEAISNEYNIDLESMVADASSPVTAAVKFQQQGTGKKVGVCLVDLSNTSIRVSEFEDNDLFSNLESLLIQLGVKEVIVPSNYDPENKQLGDVNKLFQTLDKVGVVMSTLKASFFSPKDLEQDLVKILSNEDTNVELILGAKGIASNDYQLSFACLNALIGYLGLLGDGEETKTFSIDKYDLESYMKLDSSTLNALNIFPIKQSGGYNMNIKSNQISSIFELLNKCKTNSGSRLLSQWLKQPLTDHIAISERQMLVEKLINDTNLRVFIDQEFMSQVPDIKRLIKRINSNLKKNGQDNKKLEDVVRLYQLFLNLPNLIEILKMSSDDESDSLRTLIEKNWLEPVTEKFEKLRQFQGLVETAIDLSPLTSANTVSDLNTDFNINPDFEKSLKDVNRRLLQKEGEIKQQHELVADDLNIDIDKKLKLENHQIHNWCFRVTRNDSVVLRGTNYTELQTVKAGVFFTNKELSALSKEHASILQEYNDKQKEIIQEILLITLTFETIFLELSTSLSQIDVLLAFANTSILSPIQYIKPNLVPLSERIDDETFGQRLVDLKNSRHPILEAQDDLNFIPNDVKLSNKDKSFAIITGPNMGGKSTYIRQVGVIALMSQIGCFIPCDEPGTLPIFDSILSRVGAGDSQLKGLSTFMIEMLETSSILSNATHNSLIIIDELGRGTSTYDGFGLAYSISEYIIKSKQCFTLFATHFHELTELNTKYDKIQNLQVKALIGNGEEITLVYKVEPGISSKSFGINVAELVKFPQKIINMAKRKSSELQHEEEWKSSCFKDNRLLFSTDETINKLKQISSGHKAADDKFVSEIMAML